MRDDDSSVTEDLICIQPVIATIQLQTPLTSAFKDPNCKDGSFTSSSEVS